MFSQHLSIIAILILVAVGGINGFSVKNNNNNNRRDFLHQIGKAAVATTAVTTATFTGSSSFVQPANAAPEIIKLASGVKYAITKSANGILPQNGDIVAIEYTGYLSNGQVRKCKCCLKGYSAFPVESGGKFLCRCVILLSESFKTICLYFFNASLM